jgi:hypothetical protein
VYAGGRRIATFEPESTVCQALGLPARWDGRLARLGRALTWPLRHGYQPAVMLALTLLGVLALVAGPAARRAILRPGAASSREPGHGDAPTPMEPRRAERVRERAGR